LAAILAADTAADFSGPARAVVYPAAAAAIIAAVVAAVLVGRRRTPSAMYVARLIEQRRPELKNSLMTFVELRRDPAADLSMCDAVGRRAVRLLAGVEAYEFVPDEALRPPAVAVGLAACLLGTVLWLAQGTVLGPWASSARGNTTEAPADGPQGGGSRADGAGTSPTGAAGAPGRQSGAKESAHEGR
jgi:hypothetical protein